jgi:hypothetical protein
MKTIFYAEMTDTFAGEANYSWVTRFKVHASSPLGAIRKLARETGLNFRKQWDTGDYMRYDSQSGATCVFISGYEDEAERYSRVISI